MTDAVPMLQRCAQRQQDGVVTTSGCWPPENAEEDRYIAERVLAGERLPEPEVLR